MLFLNSLCIIGRCIIINYLNLMTNCKLVSFHCRSYKTEWQGWIKQRLITANGDLAMKVCLTVSNWKPKYATRYDLPVHRHVGRIILLILAMMLLHHVIEHLQYNGHSQCQTQQTLVQLRRYQIHDINQKEC